VESDLSRIAVRSDSIVFGVCRRMIRRTRSTRSVRFIPSGERSLKEAGKIERPRLRPSEPKVSDPSPKRCFPQGWRDCQRVPADPASGRGSDRRGAGQPKTTSLRRVDNRGPGRSPDAHRPPSAESTDRHIQRSRCIISCCGSGTWIQYPQFFVMIPRGKLQSASADPCLLHHQIRLTTGYMATNNHK